RIVRVTAIARLKVGDFVRGHEDDDGLRMLEGGIEDLADVGRAFSGQLNRTCPLHRVEVDATQELEHRLAQSLIPAMDDEHRSCVLLLRHFTSSFRDGSEPTSGFESSA